MIKNYIFDFGNVLARFDPEELTTLCEEDNAVIETVRDAVFDRFYWDRLDDGTATEKSVKEELRDRLPEGLYEIGCSVYDRWIELLPPIDGMGELVSDIKKSGGKLYLLSNISIGFAEGYHKNPWIKKLFNQFDGLVFSGPIGIVKPTREIFEYLLNRYDLKAEECIFIDDSPKNIAGCQAVGIQGYLFNGDVQKLRKVLCEEIKNSDISE